MTRPPAAASAAALLFTTLTAAIYAAIHSMPALATTFIVRPFPETVGNAPVIVRGTVGASYPRWGESASGQRRIYTYTELEVTEVLKGEAGDSRALMVRELGGEKDGVAMEVSGTARFNRGEDVVLMLKGPNADGSFDVRGLMMGKLEVRLDERGEETLHGPALGKTGIKGDDEAGHPDTGGSQDSGGPWTLDRLRQLIRAQAGGEETPQKPETKDKTPQPSRKGADAGDAAPALQPQGGEGVPEPEGARQGMLETPPRFSPRFIAFALGAVIAFGAVLAFVFKGKRD